MLRAASRAPFTMHRWTPAFASAAPALRGRAAAGRPHAVPLAMPATRAFLAAGSLRRRRARLAALAAPRAVADAVESVPVGEEVDPGAVEGTDLRVLRYPHPLLRRENAEVADGELEEVRQIAKDMLLVMYASHGVGLAAPQVGVNKRLMVFNAEGDAKAWLQEVVMVNPVVVGKSKATVVDVEGCLSFPGMSGSVRRHEWVKVEATRLNGKKFRVKFEGWKARIFQHEFDHLDGVLYIDRLVDEDRPKVADRLDELVGEYEAAPSEGAPAAT